MSFLSEDDLKALLENGSAVSVSLYMPTYHRGSETQQNTIRFKNLIRQAEVQLQEYGLSQAEITTFLQRAHKLDREEFWQSQNEGLVILMGQDFFRYFCLPLKFAELVVVSDRLHLKPLMPLLIGDGQYYVLSLNQQQVKVFSGSRYTLEPVAIEGLPHSLDDALQYDETAKAGQFRISTSKGGTNNSFQHAGSFHGQGSPDQDDVTQDILQYFHILDRHLHEFLRGQTAPLIIAGVEYLLPIYREANTYPHLLTGGIPENVDLLPLPELHQRTWPLVEPYFAQTKAQAIEHYREMQPTGKTSTDVKEVVPAACYGRVEELFVAVGVQQWGVFDPQSSELEVHSDTQPGDEDLLNVAAIQMLLNGGKVYAVDPDYVPDAAPLAAVFRY
jgi:hypothetical protein